MIDTKGDMQRGMLGNYVVEVLPIDCSRLGEENVYIVNKTRQKNLQLLSIHTTLNRLQTKSITASFLHI